MRNVVKPIGEMSKIFSESLVRVVLFLRTSASEFASSYSIFVLPSLHVVRVVLFSSAFLNDCKGVSNLIFFSRLRYFSDVLLINASPIAF